jgi:hypothetical protein
MCGLPCISCIRHRPSHHAAPLHGRFFGLALSSVFGGGGTGVEGLAVKRCHVTGFCFRNVRARQPLDRQSRVAELRSLLRFLHPRGLMPALDHAELVAMQYIWLYRAGVSVQTGKHVVNVTGRCTAGIPFP